MAYQSSYFALSLWPPAETTGRCKSVLVYILLCLLVLCSSGNPCYDEAVGGRGGKSTSGNGQAWSSASPRGQWRTGENGGTWL